MMFRALIRPFLESLIAGCETVSGPKTLGMTLFVPCVYDCDGVCMFSLSQP